MTCTIDISGELIKDDEIELNGWWFSSNFTGTTLHKIVSDNHKLLQNET